MEVKKISELKVDEKFKRLTPVTEEELKALENAIVDDGEIFNPIIVWKGKGIVVDGHSRLAILKKHSNLTYSIKELPFANWEEVIVWIVERHIARKSFNLWQKLEMAMACEEYWKAKAQAKANQGTRKDILPEAGKKLESIDTNQIIADKVGCGRSTVTNFKQVYKKASEGIKEKCRQGDMTINRAYSSLKKTKDKSKGNANEIPAKATIVSEEYNIFDECENDIDVGKKDTSKDNGTPIDVRSLVDEADEADIPDGAIWIVFNEKHNQMQIIKKSIDSERGSKHIKINSFNCKYISAGNGRIIFEAEHINGGVQHCLRKDESEFEAAVNKKEV